MMLQAFSPFLIMFSNILYLSVVNTRGSLRVISSSVFCLIQFAIVSACITGLCITWTDIKVIPNDFVSKMGRGLAFGTQFYQNHGLVTSLTDNFGRMFGLKPAKSDNREKDNIKTDNTENDNNEINGSEVEKTGADKILTDKDNAETDNANKNKAQTENAEKNNTKTHNVDKDNTEIDNANKDNTQKHNADKDNTQKHKADKDNTETDNTDKDNTQTDNADKDNTRKDNGNAVKDITANLGSFFGNFVFPNPDCEGKLLVYECGVGWCGGLGDREKGIMSAFLLALLTGRTFVVDHRKPCDIKKFLEPNLYDWSKCLPHIGTSRLKGNYMVNYIDWKGNLPKSFAGFKSGDLWKEFVVTIHVNVPLLDRIKYHPDAPVRLPWLRKAPRERVFTELMHVLFKLELSLQKHLISFIENQKAGKRCHFVGAHIRSDFLTDVDIQHVFNFLANFSKQENICLYVASDNSKIRDRALKKFPNASSINRPIVHVDRATYSCDGMYTAVFEQQILSKADTLIMTPSGYSRMAAYIRGTSKNLYLLILKTGKSGSHFEQIGLDQLAQMYTTS